MKIRLPRVPRSSDGLYVAFDLQEFGRKSIEFDRARHVAHDAKLRELAQDVVNAFAQPDDYTVPRLWIVKIDALRDHLKRAP